MNPSRNHLNPQRIDAIGLQVAMIYIYYIDVKCVVEWNRNVNGVRFVFPYFVICLRKFRQPFEPNMSNVQ